MNIDPEIVKELKNVSESINKLSNCFVEEYSGITIHQTIEDIKIIYSDIHVVLNRVATALEKQLDNQIKMNESIIKNLNIDNTGKVNDKNNLRNSN